MRGTEHDIAFFLALGCAIALHCIALHCIVAFQDTVQGWVYDRAFFLRVALCRRFINKTTLKKELYAQKMGLDGMASARGHRMQGTEHDIAFSLALGCAIALHCIALHCIALYCSVLYCTAFYNCRSDRGHNCMLRR